MQHHLLPAANRSAPASDTATLLLWDQSPAPLIGPCQHGVLVATLMVITVRQELKSPQQGSHLYSLLYSTSLLYSPSARLRDEFNTGWLLMEETKSS